MQQLNSQLADSASERRERELLQRIDARDREALREFYLLYYRRLAQFLGRMTCRYEVVDEIVNDILVVVWERSGDFRGDSRVATWIMGIAYRRGLSVLEEEGRAHEHRVPARTEEQHPRDPLAKADVAQSLERALESLSPDHRAVLELTYCLGHSCEEIGAIMECATDTVKARMFHARDRLRSLAPALAAAPAAAPIAGV